MFCPKCGTENSEGLVNCVRCGSPLNNSGFPANNVPHVPNYLVWSILATIFCCLPLGIPAIVFASQVDGKLRSGDYQGAVESSKKAKLFCWLSFGLGLAGGLIYLLLVALGAISGFMGS